MQLAVPLTVSGTEAMPSPHKDQKIWPVASSELRIPATAILERTADCACPKELKMRLSGGGGGKAVAVRDTQKFRGYDLSVVPQSELRTVVVPQLRTAA